MKLSEDLRRSVLQAAIQGKLTEQRAEDGNAKDLLKEIRAEKEKLIAEGKIKREKILPAITDDEKPFEIPDNWVWVRLNSLVVNVDNFFDGDWILKENMDDNGQIRLLQLQDIGEGIFLNKSHKYINGETFEKLKCRELEEGDLMISRMAEPIARSCIVPKLNCKIITVVDVAIMRFDKNIVFNKYINFVCNSPYVKNIASSLARGATRLRITRQNLGLILIPLPPLAEQKRIVERVETIMSKLDELEKAEDELEALKKKFPSDMHDSLLQAAIQGKLTEQRPEDGTAEDLLKKIRAEKEKLIAEGKIKREKILPDIKDSEKPFEIPDNWTWVRLGDVCETNIGLTYSPSEISEKGILVLRSGNIQNGKMSYLDNVYVSKKIPDSAFINKGDILICVRNGSKKLVGKSAIVDKEGMAFGAFMAKIHSDGVDNKYIQYYIESSVFRGNLNGIGTETINQITQKKLKESLIPLPSLAEQKRIVKQLNELLPLCEAMKEK